MSTNEPRSDDSQQLDRSPQATLPGDGVAVPDFGSFLRQVFPEMQASEDVVGRLGPARGPPPIRRDYENALELLHRASDALPALLRHCQQIEGEMRRLRSDAYEDLQAAKNEMQQWRQIAVAMKMHVEESEHQMAQMRQRLALAEERLSAGQTIVQAAEQQANLAIGITTLFHDKIVDAFGTGSAAHAALDAASHASRLIADPQDRDSR